MALLPGGEQNFNYHTGNLPDGQNWYPTYCTTDAFGSLIVLKPSLMVPGAKSLGHRNGAAMQYGPQLISDIGATLSTFVATGVAGTAFSVDASGNRVVVAPSKMQAGALAITFGSDSLHLSQAAVSDLLGFL